MLFTLLPLQRILTKLWFVDDHTLLFFFIETPEVLTLFAAALCFCQIVKPSMFEKRKADPKNVAAIILGGGNGAQLFPLTKRAATPAVSVDNIQGSYQENNVSCNDNAYVSKIMKVPVGGCYRLIDIPMSNCINSCINKIFVLTQFNSASLNRHLARTYFGNGINFGGGFVEVFNQKI